MPCQQLVTSFLFLVVNLVILRLILAAQPGSDEKKDDEPSPESQDPTQQHLDAAAILSAEFTYASTTASEAMQDRHTMINYYLLIVGILGSGVVAVFAPQGRLPNEVGTVLLWLLCGIGWLYFLKLIRLRQAWHESALAMTKIKEFYLRHSKKFEPQELRTAFRWQRATIPAISTGME